MLNGTWSTLTVPINFTTMKTKKQTKTTNPNKRLVKELDQFFRSELDSTEEAWQSLPMQIKHEFIRESIIRNYNGR